MLLSKNLERQNKETLSCAENRSQEFSTRLGMAVLVAVMHAILSNPYQAGLWVFAVFLTQVIERIFSTTLKSKKPEQADTSFLIYRVFAFIATLVYSMIAPLIWFQWGEIGPAFASIALCGAILHSALTQCQSKVMFLYTVSPNGFLLVTLPLFDALIRPERFTIFAIFVTFIGLIFILHTKKAASVFRRAINELSITNAKERDLRVRSEKLIRAKAAFIETISHEIRTPLNGVIGSIELLASQDDLSLYAQEKIKTCSQSAYHLMNFLEQCLDFSRLEDPDKPLLQKEIQVSRLVTNVLSLYQTMAAQKNILLTFHENVQPLDHIEGDPTALSKILSTLTEYMLVNADSGEITITYDIKPYTENTAQLLFFIEHQGKTNLDPKSILELSGEISDEEQPLRHDTASLGLLQCKDLCKKMNGGFSFLETHNQSYKVNLELCLKYDFKNHKTIENKNTKFDSNYSVLVVDDNKTNQAILIGMLKKMNLNPDHCSNGMEALVLTDRKSYDIIMMDIQMPYMNGVECSKRIRQSSGYNASTPIIAVSANCLESQVKEYLDAGMNDYLAKPFTLKQLEKTMAFFFKKKTDNQDMDEENVEPSPTIDSNAEEDEFGALLDSQILTELISELGVEDTRDLIDGFLAELKELHDNYRLCIDQKDNAKAKKIAHQIKGSSASVSATALSAAAAKLEEKPMCDVLDEDVARLSSIIDNTQEAFKSALQ